MPSYYPQLNDVRRLVGRGKTVPVFRRLLADRLTPVGAYARLSAGADHAFLLESVVGGEQIARYSFVAAAPSALFTVKGDTGRISRPDGSHQRLEGVIDPLAELRTILADFESVPHDAIQQGLTPLPRFTGGAVGYAAYDTVRYYERLADGPNDDRQLDDLAFGIYDAMVIFDHVNKTILAVAHARLDGDDIEASYTEACERIDALVATLNQPAPGMVADFDLMTPPPPPAYESNVTQGQFEQAVRRSIEYILSGDIFQVVLSQRLRVRFAGDPFDIYRALRVVNPSPFMFYLKSPQSILVGASPEILCRVEDGVVTNRPLAGTRHRGATEEEDSRLEEELLADPKDRAEHIMLVDLGRNDVGRVAKPGSVQLNEVMSVERYSHVMHISSNVTGALADGLSAMDALRAALPVGTVSGAPKVRAMEIIDELETVRRGPYGGAVGYVDFAGNLDTCIALRTMVVTPDRASDKTPGRASAKSPGKTLGMALGKTLGKSPDKAPGHWLIDIQAGAGIVADSRPDAEYTETLNKAKALLAAIAIAADGAA